MRCSLCSATCRTRTRAQATNSKGKLVGMLVCNKCASDGILIIPSAIGSKRCTCGEPATVCGRCADKKARKPDGVQKVIAKRILMVAKAHRAATVPGGSQSANQQVIAYADGLEQAASMVEAWNP